MLCFSPSVRDCQNKTKIIFNIISIKRLIIMCELTAIIADGTKKEILMKDVIRLEVNGDEIVITGIFGDIMTVHGIIKSVDIAKQEVLIKE